VAGGSTLGQMVGASATKILCSAQLSIYFWVNIRFRQRNWDSDAENGRGMVVSVLLSEQRAQFQRGRLQGTKWSTRVAVTRRFGVRAFSSLVALLCPGPAWSCVSKLATSLLLMRLDIPVLPQSSVCGRFVSADRLFLSIKHPYTCPRSASRRRTDFTEA